MDMDMDTIEMLLHDLKLAVRACLNGAEIKQWIKAMVQKRVQQDSHQ